MMIPAVFHALPGQERKIQQALRKQKGCQIGVIKDDGATDKFLIHSRHKKRHEKAPYGSVVRLPFKHVELANNLRHKGGFIPLLLAALAPIIAGVASAAIEKKISGGNICSTCNGSGMRLNPWARQM